jgi:outer membrane protein assembly factor BamA
MRFLTAALALTGLASAAFAQPVASIVPVPAAETIPLETPAPLGLKADKPRKKITILPIPVLFYQEETGLGYGLGGLLSGRFGADTATRPSNVRAQYWTTQKKQSLLQLVHTVFTPGEKYFLSGEVSAYDILLFYYGNGNNTRLEDESALAYKLFIVNQRVQKQVANKLFAGVQYRFTGLSEIETEGSAENGGTNVFLTDGRLSPAERQDYNTSLLGPVLTYDTRDNVLASFTGNYLDVSAMFAGTGLGSDFRFARYQIDARHFRPLLGSNRTILALQALGQFHTGDVPFRELAGLGANLGGTLYNNANIMRGIYEQRFRDRQLAVLQAEVRHHLFWRIDGAVFGSTGQTGYKLNDFDADGMKYAGGAGIRFNFIRRDRVNLRLDYATGSGGFSGLYFFIGEAF